MMKTAAAVATRPKVGVGSGSGRGSGGVVGGAGAGGGCGYGSITSKLDAASQGGCYDDSITRKARRDVEQDEVVGDDGEEEEDLGMNPILPPADNNVGMKRGIMVLVSCIVLASVAIVSRKSSATSGLKYFTASNGKSSSATAAYWTLVREDYSPLPYFTSSNSEFLKYAILEEHNAVIEPGANMYLYVSDYDTSSAEYSYAFTVCDEDDACVDGALSSASTSVNVGCTPYDTYTITVNKVSASGSVSTYATGSAMCMYVRREIQSMTETHLSQTMDAMYSLWKYSDEDGKSLFGDGFHHISYFAGMHYFGASQVDADHIHEGLAFLPQHIKMTNMFEAAMQAVDPSIVLPYWDFTIDSAAGTELEDLAIFQEDTFGSLALPADEDMGWISTQNIVEDARIQDGRWADLEADQNTYFPDMKVGYGIFRAPWNMNPSPYVTRFVDLHALPGCIGYKSWAEKVTLVKFLEYAPGNPHASIHGDIGGVFGCDNLDFALEAGYLESFDKQKSLCSKWGFKMKSLYRTNDIRSFDSCAVNADSPTDSECGYTCLSSEDDMIEEMDSM
jgi:hypothetical protein